jgi:hypothetical protein
MKAPISWVANAVCKLAYYANRAGAPHLLAFTRLLV